MAYHYMIHDLVVALPFACEELEPASADAAPDIRVCEAVVPRTLTDAALCDPDFEASVDRFLYRGGMRSARFLVEGGTSIAFQQNANCEFPLFLHHLLYPVMAAALRQRNLLVLHASSAVSQRGGVLITGESGAGKSTTLAGLVARGWGLHSDDVSGLCMGPQGVLEVLPGARHLHLHEDVASLLAFATADLPRRDWHRRKVAVPVPQPALRKPCAVHRIVHLQRSNAPRIQVAAVSGRDKLPLLLGAVYGPLLPEQISMQRELIAKALADVEMIVVARPNSEWTLDAVLAVVGNA